MAGHDDFDVLEKAIRQLQIEWEKFFAGIEKKPPSDVKTRVESLIRKYAYTEIRNATERFRYQSLTSRYNTFAELWNKRLRAMEEGRPMGVHGLRAAGLQAVAAEGVSARGAAAPPVRAGASSGSGEFRVRDPELDTETVRALFERFQQARQEAGDTSAVKFESFEKLIVQQATRMIVEKRADAVDFRLETKDGKVSLKAKPVR